MCVCVCVCVCVCNIPLHFLVFAVYLLVSYMCAKIRVWSCLVTGNFGLFTEIPVCKFLRGWRAYRPKPSSFFLSFLNLVHCMCLYIFSAAFCTAHCALDLAKDHAP